MSHASARWPDVVVGLRLVASLIGHFRSGLLHNTFSHTLLATCCYGVTHVLKIANTSMDHFRFLYQIAHVTWRDFRLAGCLYAYVSLFQTSLEFG